MFTSTESFCIVLRGENTRLFEYQVVEPPGGGRVRVGMDRGINEESKGIFDVYHDCNIFVRKGPHIGLKNIL